MHPVGYRLYRLDRAGLIHEAEWFDAADDTDAANQVAAKHPDAICEIWRDKRMVVSLKPKRLSA